jgi:hypothetical protein
LHKRSLSFRVGSERAIFSMRTAIDFDDQLRLAAQKIDKEIVNRRLPDEFVPSNRRSRRWNQSTSSAEVDCSRSTRARFVFQGCARLIKISQML